MQLALNLPNPLAARAALFLSTDGQPFTTSRAVAERFGKRHKDVLKAIKNLLADMPDPAFRERNFAPTIYQVPGPKGAVRDELEYRLTHDGFALLAMGFTGRDALAWKIAFLQAFNALETELRAKTELLAAMLDIAALIHASRRKDGKHLMSLEEARAISDAVICPVSLITPPL